jgi:hypothetical protein
MVDRATPTLFAASLILIIAIELSPLFRKTLNALNYRFKEIVFVHTPPSILLKRLLEYQCQYRRNMPSTAGALLAVTARRIAVVDTENGGTEMGRPGATPGEPTLTAVFHGYLS